MRIIDAVCDHTSSYVGSLMEELTGVADSVEESPPEPHANRGEQHMIHADLDPMFNGFGPSMFG